MAARGVGAFPCSSSSGSDATVAPRDPATHDRGRAAAPPALPGHRPPRPARRLRTGRDLDPVRLRPLLREARPPRHEPLRRLPQGLPRHRRGRRLHGHREPALPEPLPAHGRPQHDARLPAGRALLLGREPLAGRQRRRPAHGLVALLELACGACEDFRRTRDLWDRGRIEAYDPVPGRTATRAATARGAYHPDEGRALRRASSSTCRTARRALRARPRAQRAIPRSARPGCSTAWASRRSRARPRRRRDRGAGRHALRATRRVVTFEDGGGRLRVHPLLPRERDVVVRGGPGLRVLDAGRRARRGLGLGPELAARPAGGRPAARRSLPEEDVADVLGRGPEKLSPSNRRAVVPGELAHGGLAAVGRERGRVPARARDRRPRSDAARGGPRSRATGSRARWWRARRPCFRRGRTRAKARRRCPTSAERASCSSGLGPRAAYELQLTSGFAPGSPVWRARPKPATKATLGTSVERRTRRPPAGAAAPEPKERR